MGVPITNPRHQIRWSGGLLVILLTITTKLAVHVAADDCLRCTDFNRQSKQQCALTYADCGGCLSGFLQDPEDPRLCFFIEVLESPPENLTLNASANVYLQCKFNAKVKCMWTKDGKVVNIGQSNRYKWSTSTDSESDDCSINIMSLANEDTGLWTCSNKADSDVDSVKAKPALVSIISKITVHPEPLYKLSRGDSVKIKCIFEQPARCSWTRNRRPIKSSGNYKFHDKYTAIDCSLTIKSFDPSNDQGNWTCSKPGDSNNEAIVSRTAQVISIENNVVDKKEPEIYLGVHNVTRMTLDYTPGLPLESLLRLSCRVSTVASRMSWLLHGDVEHPGVRLSDREIRVDRDTANGIVHQLQSEDQVELLCLVQYPDGDSHSVIVAFNRAIGSEQSTLNSSTLMTMLMILIGVMVVLICVIAGFVCCIVCNKSGTSDFWNQIQIVSAKGPTNCYSPVTTSNEQLTKEIP